MSHIGIASATVFFLLSAMITVGCLVSVGVKKQDYSRVKSNSIPIAGVIISVLAILSSMYATRENNGIGFFIPVCFIFISILNMAILILIIKKKQITPPVLGVMTVVFNAIPVFIGGCITIYAIVTSGNH